MIGEQDTRHRLEATSWPCKEQGYPNVLSAQNQSSARCQSRDLPRSVGRSRVGDLSRPTWFGGPYGQSLLCDIRRRSSLVPSARIRIETDESDTRTQAPYTVSQRACQLRAVAIPAQL